MPPKGPLCIRLYRPPDGDDDPSEAEREQEVEHRIPVGAGKEAGSLLGAGQHKGQEAGGLELAPAACMMEAVPGQALEVDQ